jgi:DNA-binding CsgD family transcriptional regulator
MGKARPKTAADDTAAHGNSRRRFLAALINDDNARLCASLTETERDIAARVARGQGDKQIAHAQGCALTTVRRHLEHIRAKLRASSRAAAAVLYALHAVLDACGDSTRDRLLSALGSEDSPRQLPRDRARAPGSEEPPWNREPRGGGGGMA